jgi:UDP-glucose 4-epimerase
MARVLVTGGAGFIGSNLVRALLDRGDDVRVLDNLSTGRRENLAELEPRIDLVKGDIRDGAAVDRATAGADYVLHLAALPSVVESMEDPLTADEVNVHGTLRVLESARRAGVRRLVYAATCAAYGDSPELPKVETMRPEPISPYAVGKLTGEHYCQVYTRSFGLPCVALRYFNIFGPRQSPTSDYAAAIPRFVTAMLAGQAPTIFGDGGQTRDFCFVANVVEANLLALAAPAAPGHVYNVALGRSYSLLEVVSLLGEVLGRKAEVRFAPPRPGDIRDSAADISAIRRDLGYGGEWDLRRGLDATVAWYASRG